MSIRRLAIVNRGEAAVRALRAVAELNLAGASPPISTIAVYTEPDADAWFLTLADEAVCIGPATYADPSDGQRKSAYHDENRVLAALTAASADAVWPGWGFVAERASFAQACTEAGICFIGPDSTTIGLLGNKMTAKKLASGAGVPVVPWSDGLVDGAAEAARHAQRLGYPVVLKAAAGGGGRGIRVVSEPSALAAALDAASTEAELAFGDPSIFCEKLISPARHIEVQVIADSVGTTWAVGVRDCTLQRRNQKVIEESVRLPGKERAIRAAAIRIAEAAGYRNAGTVEFLLDPQTGRFWFMEVNPRLQVEHPVTEATCGLDLVKLQLHIAGGGLLRGRPPACRGHAVEARLCAEDPEQGFVPAPGRIAVWHPPAGPGIRVDSGIAEGDVLPADFDSMIAKVVAWGHSRPEALARLRHALASATVVVEGGTTNRTFLISLLRNPELSAGPIDNRWLDRLVARGGHRPEPDPLAVAVAAAECYDIDHEAVVAGFRAAARHGRPESPQDTGHQVSLRYCGSRYQLTVMRTGLDSYRVDGGGGWAGLRVERRGGHRRRVICGDRDHRVLAAAHGSSLSIDIDDTVTHRVQRDDGGVVRAGFPAIVTTVPVAVGDEVTVGDPLIVLETMKMETAICADRGGRVADMMVTAGTQVTAGDPMLRICGPAGYDARDELLAGLGPPDDDADVYAALRRYLLGFDLDPPAVQRLLAAQRALAGTCVPDDPVLLTAEQDLLALFADVTGLYRSQAEPAADGEHRDSARQYLLSYLAEPDPERVSLPGDFAALLYAVLARYAVTSLDPGPQLDDALFWMFRSVHRTDQMTVAVTTVLERWLRHSDTLRPDQEVRALIDRLATAAQPRHQVVAELARDVLARFFDEPMYERMVQSIYDAARRHLGELAAMPHRSERAELIGRLVSCPQPIRRLLLLSWARADRELRAIVLEIHMRRFYRRRVLRNVQIQAVPGALLGTAEYGAHCHLVVAYTRFSAIPALLTAVTEYLGRTRHARKVTLDVVAWRAGRRLPADALAAEIGELLAGCPRSSSPHQVNVTVTNGHGVGPDHLRTNHFVFRRRGSGGFREELLYRDLHPMLAERIGFGRLSGFALQRLASAEDVYLFRGVSRHDSADVRLFAFGEVRDLTPVHDADGSVVSVPRLEFMTLRALTAMRQALAACSSGERPEPNRIELHVRPPFDLPQTLCQSLARRFGPLAAGTRLDELVLRVRVPDGERPREVDLHIAGLGSGGVRIWETPSWHDPLPPILDHQRRALRARRHGAPYPYEITTMIAPPRGTSSDFPPGSFTEYDLGADGVLGPVDRPMDKHSAGVVAGLMTNFTDAVPEGMTRVAIFGDPTRSLGALTEQECKRVIAAIDLAERLRVPVEWFAVSSGARIAWDSGTENMDWTGATLRRIVEFTQAGGEVNVVVTGINVGAQAYWNAEACMLMHTRGILVMTPASAMVLTGKQALDFSGGVSAEDNFGIGGFEQIMGPNGEAQYGAPTLASACGILLRHYEFTYVLPGERFPRRRASADPAERDVCESPHPAMAESEFTMVGDIFSDTRNPERKKPFDIRALMRAVADSDCMPLERWGRWRDAENAVVWDVRVGGIAVCMLGIESRPVARRGFVAGDGPRAWTPATLFPQASRKIARAINAASGNRPVVVLANLSGFDGSPESMRLRQLECGAEIGRAVTNFDGPIVFVVISRYHGGAFVVFSKKLNDTLEVAAVDGAHASVIGGAPAAAVVFPREVEARVARDPRVLAVRQQLAGRGAAGRLPAKAHETYEAVRAEKLAEMAAEFDRIHNIERALAVGSVDHIIPASELRPYIIAALERRMASQVT